MEIHLTNNSASRLPLLGLTMGDPAGIGPEVIVKAFAGKTVHRLCRPLVIGSIRSWKRPFGLWASPCGC